MSMHCRTKIAKAEFQLIMSLLFTNFDLFGSVMWISMGAASFKNVVYRGISKNSKGQSQKVKLKY